MRPSTGILERTTAIDATVGTSALVVGSGGRDATVLRLLVRAPDAPLVAGRLEAAGFVGRRGRWMRFADGVEGVQLLTPEGWGLRPRPGHGVEDLFAGRLPLDGSEHLARPAPHVLLVLAAHELLLGDGEPAGDRRAPAGPAVWDAAAALARRFGLSAALDLLRKALHEPGTASGWRRQRDLARALAIGPSSTRLAVVRAKAAPRRRPLLVSISGPDGSGKSTQVARLTETFTALGLATGTAWVPTTKRPTLPTSIRTWAAGWRRPAGNAGTGSDPGRPRPAGPRQVPRHVRMVEHVWITSAAVSNAAKIWVGVWRGRGREVLVLDRFVLDADVKLTYWYDLRRGADIRLERRLFRAISPRVDVQVVLAVDPETNVARRPDEWQLEAFGHFRRIYAETARELGAVVVDAERPVADVARDVTETVWGRLP